MQAQPHPPDASRSNETVSRSGWRSTFLGRVILFVSVIIVATAIFFGLRVLSPPGHETPPSQETSSAHETPAGHETSPSHETSPDQENPSGHEKMIQLLAEINRLAPEENPWIGEGPARILRRRLAAIPESAVGPRRRNTHFSLGMIEARLGEEQEAIMQFETAYRLLPSDTSDLDPEEVEQVHETIYRLGLAYLRLGETQNCCQRNTPESCVLPIRGSAIHTMRYGSEQAIQKFTEVLEKTDGHHLRSLWLLNIAYMTLGAYPDGVPEEYRISPEIFGSDVKFPRFKNIAATLGVNTFNLSGGVVLEDLDNDSYVDILTTTWDPNGPMHFFRNNQDGTFSDQTEAANLTGLLGGLNMVSADYDNDGDVDVYVLRGAWLGGAGRHPNSLLQNQGDATFTDVTFEAGMGEAYYPTQTASWSDYDNDGDLDLCVGNEHLVGNTFAAPCQLFRNNGNGTFTDVASQAGVENMSFSKGVIWGDYDGDRFPDLYVSNLGAPNRLYRNNRDGTFTDLAKKLDVIRPLGSFPTWFWDYNNDGVLDLYVPSYVGLAPGLGGLAASFIGRTHGLDLPKLYQGDGQGGFQDVAADADLLRLTFPMGSNFGDLDNDGFLDFYLGTGYPDYESLIPNFMYHNISGQRFQDVTYSGGFGNLQKGHAVAFADFDQDGDQDIFAQMGGAFPGDKFSDSLYENPGFDNHWLTIRLVGVRSNRSAIGARIKVDVMENGNRRSIFKHVNSGGSFGCNPFRQTIGLGKATRIERLEVYWPTTDLTQVFFPVEMNQFIQVVEGDDQFKPLPFQRVPFNGSDSR